MPRVVANPFQPGGCHRPEFQCVRIRRNGERCRKWALKGTTLCRSHGGTATRKNHLNKVGRIPLRYSRYLSKTLKEVLEEQLNAPDPVADLSEELVLMRECAGQAIKLYDLALQSEKPELTQNAALVLRDALKDVSDIAVKHTTILEKQSGKFDVQHLAYVSNAICKLVYEVFGELAPELAEEFIDKLPRIIKLPDNKGTDSTPDQDVAEMDDTVPLLEGA